MERREQQKVRKSTVLDLMLIMVILDISSPTPPQATSASAPSAPAPKKRKVSYTYEVVDGWIRCRLVRGGVSIYKSRSVYLNYF